MPMDGLTIHACLQEINSAAAGARIDRITQPEADTVLLHLRQNGISRRLLLCANPSFARIHFTLQTYQNPSAAPMFCMLLRKHLTGARLQKAEQLGNDRIAVLHFQSLNDFGEPESTRLIAEIMGKHSNLSFVREDGTIIDSIRHINFSMSRVRQLQPGLPYVFPPVQDKTDPFAFHGQFPLTGSAKFFLEHFSGISPSAAEELAFRAESSSPEKALDEFLIPFREGLYAPRVLFAPDRTPLDFFPVPYLRCRQEDQLPAGSVSEAIETFFVERDKAQRVREEARDLKAKLTLSLERCEKNRRIQQDKLLECRDMEIMRVRGELLTANLYKVQRDKPAVTVDNYYTGQSEVIPLDIRLSPAANAQHYFKQYGKLKTAARLLQEQIRENDERTSLVQGLLEELDCCETKEDLAEVRSELEAHGFIKKKAGIKTQHRESTPMRFVSSSGIPISVGKNSLQNDRLTFSALPEEYWLHVKDSHGSHVIIRSSAPDNATLEEAATLAVWYSGARTSASVAVDCTQRRYIRRPSGAAPGRVIYTHQTTYYVTATEKKINAIRKENT